MKKLSLLALCVIFSMFFFVSCVEDEEEDLVDTETGDTTADTTDPGADTTDTGADTTDPGADTTDTGADTTDTGADTTDTGADTTDTGADTTDTGADTTDTGADTTDTGADTTDTGADTTDTGVDTTDTGADTTDTDSTYTGDNSNLNTGDTSGNQAQSGKVGAACTSDSNCKGSYGSGDSEQVPVCLTADFEYFPAPGGYCTFLCDMTDDSACKNANGICYGYGSYSDGYCFHKCTKPSDCRVGYRCSNKIHACMPDCVASGCATGKCDTTDGVCLKSGY